MTYEEDKIYLKDTRNGNIYLYERFLAKDKNFVACVPNPSKKESEKPSEGTETVET